MSLSSINFLHLTVSGQDFIGQGHYSKVKSRSNHDVAHLHPLTNVPTKYQLPTPYGFWDRARKNFFPPPTRPPIWTPWVKTTSLDPHIFNLHLFGSMIQEFGTWGFSERKRLMLASPHLGRFVIACWQLSSITLFTSYKTFNCYPYKLYYNKII